jgi:ribulose bisphosphate carboxylase small subunit
MILRETTVNEDKAKFILYKASDNVWDCDEVDDFAEEHKNYIQVVGFNNAKKKRHELNGYIVNGDEYF